jgi:hypothetical protein
MTTQLAYELRSPIPPNVMSLFVKSAPEPRMLRNEKNHATAWSQGLRDLADHDLVFIDVLEDVERAHDVEHAIKGKKARVELQQFDARKAPARDGKPFLVHLAPDDAHRRKRLMDVGKDVSGAGSQLQEVSRIREVTADHSDDHSIPSPEPEARSLGAFQLVKSLDREALGLAHRIRL